MEVIPFNETHLIHLDEWLKGHKLDSSLIYEIPKIGFIAHESDIFYAAGFIRRLEACDSALLDGLIANPKTFGKARYRAIDLVVQALSKKAKELKLKQLLAYSVDKATIKRSVRHGFKKLQHTVIALNLGD